MDQELSGAMEKLKLHLEADTKAGLDALLQTLEGEDLDRVKATQSLVDGGILCELHRVLQSDPANQEAAAQVVAELAKVESVRQPSVSEGLVPPLMALLVSPNIAMSTQACRALGNICFDCDHAREAVDTCNGVITLLGLLKSHLGSSAEGAAKIRMVACGFLLNLSNTHESVQEKAISQGAMEVLDDYLKQHNDDEGVCQMALLCVGSLADSEVGKDKLSECEIAVTIGKLLVTPGGVDQQDVILELLANLAECDDVKVQLAKSDLKTDLIKLVRETEGSTEEDSQALLKLASDLIVLLLTGDESMEILYEGGAGVIFKESLAWLKSSSSHLHMSGALAVGNFARNDAHCIKLVEDGITEQLLTLLRDNSSTVSPTLQHATFSALRNLAIPGANKAAMLKCGLIEVTLQYIGADMTAVQFKLLGLLRMLVDGQEDAAKTLGTNDTFMSRLVEWCDVQDHAGVKGEANRLVAWLVKHSRSSGVMKMVLAKGAIPHLVAMANAEHAVMQNEALIALTLTASTILGEVSKALVEAELVPTIKLLLTEEDTLAEIICNVLTFIKALTPSDEIMELMKLAEIPKDLKKLVSHEDSMVQKQAKDVSAVFGKG